jgi:hypothetical protein
MCAPRALNLFSSSKNDKKSLCIFLVNITSNIGDFTSTWNFMKNQKSQNIPKWPKIMILDGIKKYFKIS